MSCAALGSVTQGGIEMYTLEDVRAEYDRLDTLCKVDTSAIQLRISSRGIRRYGFCSFRKEGKKLVPRVISLADHIFNEEDIFWQTVRHEYAHALASLRDGKKHGHDDAWKRACREVGCDPTRLIDAQPSPELVARREQRVKYILICDSCGKEYHYYRRGKVVDAFLTGRSGYKCGKCRHALRLIVKGAERQ